MLNIFYSPHATSVDNEAKRASGHADVPLSAAGQRQAQELGQHYATKKLDAIFCSDLQRAWTTVEIAFASRKLPVVRDARLRECDYGAMTQHPFAQIERERPMRVVEPFPDGESILMVVQRVGAFLRAISNEYSDKTIVIIGHSATKYALEYWCGNVPLGKIVTTTWEWRDIPIWHYEIDGHTNVPIGNVPAIEQSVGA